MTKEHVFTHCSPTPQDTKEGRFYRKPFSQLDKEVFVKTAFKLGILSKFGMFTMLSYIKES